MVAKYEYNVSLVTEDPRDVTKTKYLRAGTSEYYFINTSRLHSQGPTFSKASINQFSEVSIPGMPTD